MQKSSKSLVAQTYASMIRSTNQKTKLEYASFALPIAESLAQIF